MNNFLFVNFLRCTFFVHVICFSYCFSQEDRTYFLYNSYQVGDSIYIGIEGPLRSFPSRSSKIIKNLSVGDKVYYLGWGPREEVKRETIYGIDAEFICVEFLIDGNYETGYIWGGLLAQVDAFDSKNNQYLYSFKNFNSKDGTMDLRLTRIDASSKSIYHQNFIDTIGYEQHKVGKILGPMGLSNVQSIFRVGYLGEACGILTIYNYYAWNGKEFIQLPSKKSVADGGVYYYAETLQFPTEHKYGNDLIIITSEEMEAEEIVFEGVADAWFTNAVTTSRTSVYKWTGKGYHKLHQIEE